MFNLNYNPLCPMGSNLQMADAVSDTGAGRVVGGVGTIIGDAVVAFNKSNVMLPLVTAKQCPKGALTCQFVDYTKIASSDVAEATDGADVSTMTSIDTAAKSATVSEHVIRTDVSDLARMGSAEDYTGNVGDVLGNAVAAKLDADLTALGTGFSQTECGAGTALSLDHIFGSMRQLRSAGAPYPYSLVLSPKQVWGSKGLSGLLVDPSAGAQADNPLSTAKLTNGEVGTIAGFNVYWSDQINENVGSGGDAAGFAMSKGAIGCAVGPEGLIRIETERDASFRTTQYVAVGFWGEIEIHDGFGVYVLSDVA